LNQTHESTYVGGDNTIKIENMISFHIFVMVVINYQKGGDSKPSLVLVINDTKLLMPCVKCFELGISNTCDEGACGKEWWPQDHKEMVHKHEMMIMK
jgi:hypothetical protein